MHIFRIRSGRTSAAASETRPRGSPRALELLEESTGAVLVSCLFGGRFVLNRVSLATTDGKNWEVVPNRTVMPTRWTVAVDGAPVVNYVVPALGRLVNPVHRTAVIALDPDGSESFRVMDLRKSAADRLIGSGPRDWMLVRDGGEIGKLTSLPRPVPENVGRLRRFIARLGYDPGVVSFADDPVLVAPAALALVAIHRDHTDASGG